MMNRRGFLNKFLKGAAISAVAAPLLLQPKRKITESEFNAEVQKVFDDAEVIQLPYQEGDIMDYITNISPADSPMFKHLAEREECGGLTHEWLNDPLSPNHDEFRAEVERKARAISRDIEQKLFSGEYAPYDFNDRIAGEDVEKRRADLADWINQESFSREAMEAACGQNPSYFPEGSRERITALGAEAVKRSAEPLGHATPEAQTAYSNAKESFDYGGWMDGTAKKCGSSPA